jgi:hypothetical protein
MADRMTGAGSTSGFGYFVLKMQRTAPGDPPICAGVVERLGTAERRSFETAEELVRLLAAWLGDATKMR